MSVPRPEGPSQSDSWRPLTVVVSPEWLETGLMADMVAEVTRRERMLFDELAGGATTPVVLFGAGHLGRRTLAGLRHVGVQPLAFVDNNAALQGCEIDGLAVHAPADAATRFAHAAFVVTVWSPVRALAFAPVSRQLKELGAERVVSFVPLFWKYADEFLPYDCLDLPHKVYEAADAYRAAFGLLRDDASRAEFLLQLCRLLSQMDTVDLPRGLASGYFPSDLIHLGEGEFFVDCGAYDGDTLEEFRAESRGRFAGVAAFEPDPAAAKRLVDLVGGLPPELSARIHVERAAVGATDGLAAFAAHGGPGSRVSAKGSLAVKQVALDSALVGRTPTFVKMDVEGSEVAALYGSRRLIARHRPVLAVCVYHLQADLHMVPNTISALCPNYSLYLRRRGPDGDLVCFAVPDERLRAERRSLP